MGEQTLCEQATDTTRREPLGRSRGRTTIDRLAELSESLAELHGLLLAGDPDEILKLAQATCLLAGDLEGSEAAPPSADYIDPSRAPGSFKQPNDRDRLLEFAAEVRKQARLCLIVAKSALRVRERTMAALRGTSEYGPTGEKILQGANCALSEVG